MDAQPQSDSPDLSRERCSLQVQGESGYGRFDGACDQMECGQKSTIVCASEDCGNCPCRRHARQCPTCLQHFCVSSLNPFACFFEHVEGKCQEEILRVPLGRLNHALNSGQHRELEDFINRDSDGLGHPLPRQVCTNLGLAVTYSKDLIPDYNEDILTARKVEQRARRTRMQKMRRSAKRLGTSVVIPAPEHKRLAPFRNSTIYLVTGARMILHWTGACHYPEQLEMLDIMGLSRNPDFIRDKVDYLERKRPELFKTIESWAAEVKKYR